MAMTHQNIVALVLLIAAVLLLVRQVARMIAGKTRGCSCVPRRDESTDTSSDDPPKESKE
jgi:hypothetical protein